MFVDFFLFFFIKPILLCEFIQINALKYSQLISVWQILKFILPKIHFPTDFQWISHTSWKSIIAFIQQKLSQF